MYKIGLAYSSDPTQRSSKRCERFRKDVSEQVKSKGGVLYLIENFIFAFCYYIRKRVALAF